MIQAGAYFKEFYSRKGSNGFARYRCQKRSLFSHYCIVTLTQGLSNFYLNSALHPVTEVGFKQFIFIPSDFTVLLTSPEAATRVVLYKKLVLKISQYSQENTCVGVLFIKSRFQHKCFSCEYCEMFKGTYFEEQLRMAAYVSHTKVPPQGPTLGSHLRVPP